jgi:hypothetical protein
LTLTVRHAFRVLFCLEPSFEMQAMDVGLAERHSLALAGRHLVGVDTFEAVIYLPLIGSDKDRH